MSHPIRRVRRFAFLLVVFAATSAQEFTCVAGPNGLCAGLRLSPSDAVLGVGETLVVRINGGAGSAACGFAPDSTPATASWRSTNPKIATVDAAGVVTAVNPGAASITLVPGPDADWRSTKVTVTVIK